MTKKQFAAITNSDEKYQQLINWYINLYHLQQISNRIDVSRDLFNYCQRGQTFVLVILVNTKGQIYFRTPLDHPVYWELPGGFVENSDVSLEAAAARIVQRESSLRVDEIRPLAVVQNEFVYQKKSHVHCGLVYIALVRTPKNQVKTDFHLGEFASTVPSRTAETDQAISQLAFDYLKTHSFNPPFNEIDQSSGLGWRHFIHHLLIQPVQRLLSSSRIRVAITKALTGKTIIDVSCGDDTFIVNLANTRPAIEFVANDIVWPLVSKLATKARYQNIIFTNHDIKQLPYQDKFDTVIFKNSLHHFNYNEAKVLLKKLYNLSNKRLIVVDVEDPRTTKYSHYLWNQYYVRFLRDQGTDFWRYEAFQKLTLSIGSAKVERISTQRANYMMAIYDK